MQLLQKSGNLLLKSMDYLAEKEGDEDYNVMEIVELAKALSGTVQTQANMVKAITSIKKDRGTL